MTERLQKVFKTLADPTRVRILALLEPEELAVQDLMEVMGMAQSRVSRHLAILREAGLLTDRKDGTFTYYRLSTPLEEDWSEAWQLVRRSLPEDPAVQTDAANLERILSLRAAGSRTWFDSVGPEWDALRKVFNDDALRARAINRALPKDLVVADIGTGTGILATELAHLGLKVIAVDQSTRMIQAAQEKFREAGVEGRIELREGNTSRLPLEDAEVDTALAHMVLHYVASPGEAIQEMTRIVKPGGIVTVVDFLAHQKEWMREELGVVWLGFSEEDIRAWFKEAGLSDVSVEVQAPLSGGRDLPATFIASGQRPEK